MNLKPGLSLGIILSLFLCIFVSLGYTYEGYISARERAIDEALGLNARERLIDKTLRRIKIELTLEYVFAAQGEQVFELFNDFDGDGDQERVSRLEYPHRGGLLIFKGEIGFLPKVSLGARYGSSLFSRRTATDQDWFPIISEEIVWLESESRCRPEIEFYDLNLYYCLLELDEDEVKQRRLSSEQDTLFDFLNINSLSLDIFAGYQQQKGRYPMTNGVWKIFNYAPVYQPFGGLASFYKTRYRGPRLGLRTEGSSGKVTSRLSFAYAWLRTKGYGWWNLRDLSFWQTGKRGDGIDIGLELIYPFTTSFSVGLGFNYLYSRQKNLTLCAIEAGFPWPGGPTVRNADSRIYGPSVIFKSIW